MQTQIQSFCTSVGAPFHYISRIFHINLYMVLQTYESEYAGWLCMICRSILWMKWNIKIIRDGTVKNPNPYYCFVDSHQLLWKQVSESTLQLHAVVLHVPYYRKNWENCTQKQHRRSKIMAGATQEKKRGIWVWKDTLLRASGNEEKYVEEWAKKAAMILIETEVFIFFKASSKGMCKTRHRGIFFTGFCSPLHSDKPAGHGSASPLHLPL